MIANREDPRRALKRLLANGPLTAVPKRPADQQLLLVLAAARFESQRAYREAEVNEILKTWLETFCEPYGIDHVTLRRMLVDARLLKRPKSGASYEVDSQELGEAAAMSQPAEVLAEIRSERASRKQQRPA